jgi:hypothetical protein
MNEKPALPAGIFVTIFQKFILVTFSFMDCIILFFVMSIIHKSKLPAVVPKDRPQRNLAFSVGTYFLPRNVHKGICKHRRCYQAWRSFEVTNPEWSLNVHEGQGQNCRQFRGFQRSHTGLYGSDSAMIGN